LVREQMLWAIIGEQGLYLLVQPEVWAPEGPEIRFIEVSYMWCSVVVCGVWCVVCGV
jgi:hypothetical protein